MGVLGRLLVAAFLGLLIGCSTPSSPVGPSPPAADPSQSPLESFVVSGTLSEMIDGVSHPLAGRQVHLYISGTCGPQAPPGRCRVERGRQPFTTDQNGRYAAEVPKSWVFVSANVPGVQPCVASAAVDRDTIIDVQVVPAGSPVTPPSAASPMMTGFVYETATEGRRPLRGVDVWLEVGIEGYLVASTRTDDAGRFFLCRVNAPEPMVNAHLLMYVALSGYQGAPAQPIPAMGDVFFEIELTR